MQTVEVKLDRFDGGITSDGRDNSAGLVKMIKHFDVLTTPHTLIPFNSRTSGDVSSATQQMTDFFYYNSLVYGIGVDSGTSKTTVHKIAPADFAAATWSSMGNNASAAGTFVRGVWVEYQGYGFGINSDGTVFRNSLSGAAWADTVTTIGSAIGAVGSIAGLVHSKDDRLYLASANVIASVPSATGTWVASALTLPARYLITSLCEYGNYLAIACKPKYAGNSVVFLWDRNSSVTTLSESIDWGYGNLQIIEQVEGELIGITIRNNVFTGLPEKLVFRHYISGAGSVIFKELNITGGSTDGKIYTGKKFNANRLYFIADISVDGVLHNGIWGLGKNQAGRWIVWFDKLPNNDTAVASSAMRGFFMIGDSAWISYEDSGYKLTQTITTGTYTGTSLLETTIQNAGDASKKKGLVGVTVTFDTLPTAGVVILKYRKDGETSWTQIFTEGTDGLISRSATSIENLTAGGDTVTISIATPAVVTFTAHKLVAGQKIRFSTTGALPTGITAGVDYYVLSTSLAADTFKFSDTVGGTAINTSGSQSGTHTIDRKVELPEFKEIEFRIESTGGAKITGLSFKANILDQKPY